MRNIKWEVALKIIKVNSKAALREEKKDRNKKDFKPENYNQNKKTPPL